MGENEGRSRKIFHRLRLAALLLVCGGALQAQEPEGNIAGQIHLVDGSFPSGRLPVTLEIHRSIADVSYCDSEGRFGFNHLLPNAYEVVIEAEGYQPVRLTVVVNPITIPTNIVHVVLRPKAAEKLGGSPEGATGGNPDIVGVAELKKKFTPGVIKEFEEGKKAEQHGDLEAA